MTTSALLYLSIGVFLVVLVLVLTLPGLLAAVRKDKMIAKRRHKDPHSLYPEEFQETDGRQK